MAATTSTTKSMIAVLSLATALGCRSVAASSETTSAQPMLAADTQPSTPPSDTAGREGTTCVFGETVADLAASPDFRRTERGGQKRSPLGGGRQRTYAVTDFKEMTSGARYTLYLADETRDEGPTGWIERDGAAVAQIAAGSIAQCTIMAAPKVSPSDDCLFGEDIASLLGMGEFTVKALPDGRAASPLSGDRQAVREVLIRDLAHLKSSTAYKLYALKDEADLSSQATGWIEDQMGQVVAQFGVGEIYRCQLNRAGSPRLADDSSACSFGADLEDLETSPDFAAIATTEVSRAPRIADAKGEAGQVRTFLKRTVKHALSGKVFSVFQSETGSETIPTGWIEAESGEVVAEFTGSGFQHCRF